MARHAADSKVMKALEAFLGGSRARRRGPVVVLVDSTGMTLAGPGGYLRDKHGDQRRGKYHILHLATDAATGEILEFELTESTRCQNPEEHKDGIECDCPKIGDAPVAQTLLTRLVEAGMEVVALVGDGAYAGSPLRTVASSLGAFVVAPLPSNAVYQREDNPGSVERNNQLMQENHLGQAEWKERSRCHVRSSVEADIGALKTTMGDKIGAKRFDRATSEITARIQLRNYHMFN